MFQLSRWFKKSYLTAMAENNLSLSGKDASEGL
jgi:hypothetical protein